MGKFFKALEQAERERSLREEALRLATSGESVSKAPAPQSVSGQPVLTPSVFQRPPVAEHIPAPSTREVSAHEPPTGSTGRVEEHLVSLLAPTSFGAEQYRRLRHRVEEMHRSTNLTVLGISSPEAGDGKTITTINLAGALAQSPEARILIVDADLRRSSLTEYLGLDASRTRGLVGAILDSRLSLKDVVDSCPPFNISVVQAGKHPSAPYELLKSPRLAQLLEEARQQYDYVILDMPPLVPLPDCSVIGRSVDGFLVVITAHKTPRKLLKEALSVLEPATVLGLVFNADDAPRASYYNYGARSSRRGRSVANRDEAQ